MKLRLSLLSLALLPLVTASPPVVAQAQSPSLVTVQVKNAPLDAVAKEVASATGKRIVVAPNATGSISLETDGPVTVSQLYATFVSVLRARGYVVEERDGTVWIGAKL